MATFSNTLNSTQNLTQNRIFWGIRIVLALAFAAAGAAKLAGVPQMVATFEAIGFGQWFRYVTGGIEVVGAILLLLPATALYAGEPSRASEPK